MKIVKDYGTHFLRDDREIREGSELFDGEEEAYSLFQREPYHRVVVYAGPLEHALIKAYFEVYWFKCKLQGTRISWMKLIGFTNEEIKTSLKTNFPTSIVEEEKQLEAAQRLSDTRK
jgi:hypothetical protein